MIEFYIHKDQLANWLMNEPVEFINYIMDNNYVKVQYPDNKVIITYLRNGQIIIEKKTFRKRFSRKFRKK